MSFLFHGDPRNLRKRATYQFKSIEKSDAFRSLQAIPELPASSCLRQDHLFAKVSDQVHHICTDVSVVFSRVRNEIDTEVSQTEEINDKINHSIRRLEASYGKLIKLRSKFSKSTSKQRTQFEDKYSQLDKKTRMIKDANDELLEYVIERGVTRLDSKRFRRIAKLLAERYPDQYIPDMRQNYTAELDANSQQDRESNDETDTTNAEGHTDGQREASSELNDHSNRRSLKEQMTFRDRIASAPMALTSVRGASEPSIAATLASVCITEPFERPRDTIRTADATVWSQNQR